MRLFAYTFIALIFSLLCLRSLDPHHWSDWEFGDAQTMMASQNFSRNGFLKTFFLWIPQGATSATLHLDDEALRQHAHGSPGDRSGVGPKLFYTHWPSFYSLSFGVLAKLGISHKSVYQALAIFTSCIGLIFLYLFLELTLTSQLAFFSLVLYALHLPFLRYADSLATMPADDLFRFAFLYFWARYRLRQSSASFGCALLCVLGASLTTLDSIFFLPVSAAVFDLCVRRRLQIRAWAAICGVTLIALAIQFTQNAFYMGTATAIQDWVGYYTAYGNLTFFDRLLAVRALVVRTSFYSFSVAIGLSLGAYFFQRKTVPYFGVVLLTFFVAGSAFGLLLPAKIEMRYESRQLAPYFALLWAGLISGILELRLFRQASFTARALYGTAFVVLGLWSLNLYQFSRWYTGARGGITFVAPEVTEFFAPIKKQVPGDKVYFQVERVFPANPYFTKGFEQIEPSIEWESRGLILTVPDVSAFVADLNSIWSKTRDFTPILIVNEGKAGLSALEPYLKELKYSSTLRPISRRRDGAVAYELVPAALPQATPES